MRVVSRISILYANSECYYTATVNSYCEQFMGLWGTQYTLVQALFLRRGEPGNEAALLPLAPV